MSFRVALATPLLALAGSVLAVAAVSTGAVPGRSGSNPPSVPSPFLLRVPGDSLWIGFGDFRRWIPVAGIPSPDTTYLSPEHDLVLRSATDSLAIPRSPAPATVRLVRASGELIEVFFFETRSARDLREYRSLLARWSRYGRARPRIRVAFLDSAAQDADARALRARFPIDSIAGHGGDLTRMRNLLHWVHGRIHWDGSRDNPAESTLVSSVEACVSRGLTMNCGGLAETYAAMCRAAGFAARRIVCLPFDPRDPDCHSVVIVYSDSLRRWVYMDPTFEASWTDAKGRPLGLAEARALLARGDTVLVSPDANCNGERRDPTEHLAYMSKNLFRFKAWPDGRRAMMLNPSGYEAAPDSGEIGRGTPIVTDDPVVFWAPPGGGQRAAPGHSGIGSPGSAPRH
jgi:hypothetical protein